MMTMMTMTMLVILTFTISTGESRGTCACVAFTAVGMYMANRARAAGIRRARINWNINNQRILQLNFTVNIWSSILKHPMKSFKTYIFLDNFFFFFFFVKSLFVIVLP